MANRLYASVNGCSDIISVTVSDSHTAPTSSATVVCLSSSLDVGDSISIDIGYSSDHGSVFSGYVKNVQRSQSPTRYEITCANEMVRAIDYFIVSQSPLTPYSAENIKAEDLVGDLMAMAGISSYDGDNTHFTFATNGIPLEVNITSVYDFCKMIAGVLAWHLYADDSGTVHFVDRPPFPDGDSSVATLDSTNLIDVSYWRSDRDLRNRVVVYGAEGIFAESKASSPYLPGGFYKSVLVAAPTLLSTYALAKTTANYNLAVLNRLTIGGSATMIGDANVHCRDCVQVNKSDIGMSGQFYVFGLEHSWSEAGFTTALELRK